MRYQAIPTDLFKQNRQRFTRKMLPNSIAFFNSNDIFITGADSTLPFQQHSDIFYLSGIDQEESVLVLYPDAPNPQQQAMLFVKETSPLIAVWEGHKLTQQQATNISGISAVYWLSELETTLDELIPQAKHLYINQNLHKRATKEMQSREDRFVAKLKNQYPNHQYRSSFDILFELRGIKSATEIALIQQACDITEKGFRKILPLVKPGMYEFEIEAELIAEFIRNRSNGFAYTPIIASGANANILHYIENNKLCKSGDLILLDVAANYANYSSDLTRCIPVNGRFTQRQKEIYSSVLNVKNKATEILTDGLLWKDYNRYVGELMTAELLNLGLLTKIDIQQQTPESPAYKKYYMHGTSHHLGLDTHDYGDYENVIKANMVLTVEPGIYIPEEGIGIRLEDNVVVQEQGAPINLMQNIPITIEEIEELMNEPIKG